MLKVLFAPNGLLPLTVSIPTDNPGAIVPLLVGVTENDNIPMPFNIPVAVFVNVELLTSVPLLILIVPLLLHDVAVIVVEPTPVCLVIVPLLVKVEVVVQELSPFAVIVPSVSYTHLRAHETPEHL